MGAGNHFVEVDRVDEIYDEEVAKTFGLSKDQIVVLIHTGSRGLGHQVATDYIRTMLKVMPKYNITLPDRELACAPFSSAEGTAYFNAMSAAANFAWANRQMITDEVRDVWKKMFDRKISIFMTWLTISEKSRNMMAKKLLFTERARPAHFLVSPF